MIFFSRAPGIAPPPEPRSEPEPLVATRPEPSVPIDDQDFEREAPRREPLRSEASEAPGISAPAAIALGAAAGAGTAAVASSILAASPADGVGAGDRKAAAEADAEVDAQTADGSVEIDEDVRIAALHPIESGETPGQETPADETPADETPADDEPESDAASLDRDDDEALFRANDETSAPDDEDQVLVTAQEELAQEELAQEELAAEEREATMAGEGEERGLGLTTTELRSEDTQPQSLASDHPEAEIREPLTVTTGPEPEFPLPETGASALEEPEPPQELSERPMEEAAEENAEIDAPSAETVEDREPDVTPSEEDAASEPDEEPARLVVGTYESGGNTYTMYSDGSIDARTPAGEFHFASLDELKRFIAEGGEDRQG
jgi:hypothetical protein